MSTFVKMHHHHLHSTNAKVYRPGLEGTHVQALWSWSVHQDLLLIS